MSKMLTETSQNSFHFPLISDQVIANQKLNDFVAQYNESYPIDIKNIIDVKQYEKLLVSIFSNSPYLTKLLFKHTDFTLKLFENDADTLIEEIFSNLKSRSLEFSSQTDLMRTLRIAKAEMALTVGIADLSGKWPLSKITKTLSEFAQISLEITVNYLLREGIASGNIDHDFEEGNEGKNSGYIILAMGKLGGYELNYSSDIDLIVLFDPEVIKYTGRRSVQDFFVKLTQKLVKIISDRTEDGYVFRTDLRLRPDPGATAVAISVDGAEIYYQTVGLNWERAAMIKARPVAGDLAAGAEFLERLQPFVWRRNLDYAAIADIHSIMRKIHSHEGDGDIAVEGHNVKLGRGGIRDIEFFAQTQQLIAGGREPGLRLSATVAALDALAMGGWIDGVAADELTKAYEFLRQLEHRLQMVADEQTQTMPKTADGVDHMAAFMGFATGTDFRAALLHHLGRVRHHHGLLFDATPDRLGDGNLLFTGTDDDPHTLEELTKMGFEGAQGASQTVRSWHHGRYRAMRSARARELLTALMPALLQAFADTANPNATLGRFDRFLSNLPTGVQLFSMLTARPQLLDLLAEIMGKEGGVCAGRGGSQHLCAGHFFSYGIQGGYLATAVGMALAEKTRQSNAIVVAFIGDGTLGQGTVYEALNMASLFRVPLLIVIENNYYAQTTSIQDNLAGSIEKRATAFDLSYGEISSNDAQELYPRFEKLCDHVRRNSVCHVETVNTYRLNAHSKGDDYRDPSEIARWKKSDPLLIAAKTINSTVKSEIDQRISDRLASVQISVDNMPFASL